VDHPVLAARCPARPHRARLRRRAVEHVAVTDREALSLLWLPTHELPARGDHGVVHALVAVLVAAVTYARRLGLPGTLWERVGIAAVSLLPVPG